MNKNNFFGGIKFGSGILLVIFMLFGLVYAVGFHTANEILPGTMNGNYKINGTLNVTGNVYIGGNLSDLAENIWTAEGVGPGDLVVLSGGENVELTSTPYDKRVAGVISTAPATVFGIENGDQPLAISGRVPVKVTNENGAIVVSDLLTSSSTPGSAMKCSDANLCFGAIVGKAMEPMNDVNGEVLMLIMLN